jgi:two-component system OmpR family response regulator
LVVDDDDAFRRLLVAVLSQAGFETIEAGSGEEALAEIAAAPPRLLILDVNLPGICGYEVCRKVREDLGAEVPIPFISGERTESFDRVAGLIVGGDDYLAKPVAPDELVERVRSLLRRTAPAPPGGPRLTERELEVLRLLAEGASAPEIARELVISPKTVRGHIEHILRKLDVHTRAQAVALAYREALLKTVA